MPPYYQTSTQYHSPYYAQPSSLQGQGSGDEMPACMEALAQILLQIAQYFQATPNAGARGENASATQGIGQARPRQAVSSAGDACQCGYGDQMSQLMPQYTPPADPLDDPSAYMAPAVQQGSPAYAQQDLPWQPGAAQYPETEDGAEPQDYSQAQQSMPQNAWQQPQAVPAQATAQPAACEQTASPAQRAVPTPTTQSTQASSTGSGAGAFSAPTASQAAQGAAAGYVTARDKPQLDTYTSPGMAARKQELLHAADSIGATPQEKAIALAIANQETECIDTRYQSGDGKGGASFNVSPFKMNVGQLAKIDPSVDPQKVHQDLGLATQMLIKGMRQQGIERFLMEHRGGEGAFNGSIPKARIDDYLTGIKDVAADILANPAFLTNDQRIKKDIVAI